MSKPAAATTVMEQVLQTIAGEELVPGLMRWKNPRNGFTVVDLHYRADPRKARPEWIAEARSGTPKAIWNREHGEDWNVFEGKPVYQDYDKSVHRTFGNIIAPRRSRLVCGWDGGPTDLNLAWALGLTAPGDPKVTFIDEYYVDDGDVEDFVQVVASRLQLEWMKLGGFTLHFTDQAVFTVTGLTKKSMADAMRSHGFNPQPSEISFAKRRASVEKLLTSFTKAVDGKLVPRLRVHERCELINAGFEGGYRYPEIASMKGSMYRETPLKDRFSHVMNAVEYVAARLHVVGQHIPYEGRPLPALRVI